MKFFEQIHRLYFNEVKDAQNFYYNHILPSLNDEIKRLNNVDYDRPGVAFAFELKPYIGDKKIGSYEELIKIAKSYVEQKILSLQSKIEQAHKKVIASLDEYNEFRIANGYSALISLPSCSSEALKIL